MDNSFFVYSDEIKNLSIERFHLCSWDFRDRTSLIEFGIELNSNELVDKDNITIKIFIPWLNDKCTIEDYFSKFKSSENVKFIFNDVALGHDIINEDSNKWGILQKFKERENICILPTEGKVNGNVIELKINLEGYHISTDFTKGCNVYIRTAIKPEKENSIALKKRGINKSTFIFDIKLNEKRNLPVNIEPRFPCKIKDSFYFNIVPNDYSLNFYDSKSLKNVRTLEFNGFKCYMNDERIKRDDLVVVFSKINDGANHSYFNVYTNEFIGVGALAIALLINLLSGILLFLPSLKTGKDKSYSFFNLPWEANIAISLWFLIFIYFILKKFKPNWIKW
jgi:hypothetical protein